MFAWFRKWPSALEDDPPINDFEVPDDPKSAPSPLVPSLSSMVLMAAGATLMIAGVFGSELVRDASARFSWVRLAIAGFGLLALLAGLAWLLAPPSTKRGD